MTTLLAHPLDDTALIEAASIQAATRREFLAALAAAGLLAGCTAATDDAGAPSRTVVDGAGRSVDIPTDPQRVVVIDANRTIVNLVALGIEPAGATINRTNPDGRFAPALGAAGDRIQPIGATDSVDLEQVAALDPDLIITFSADAVPLSTLETLAPTLVVGNENFDGLFSNLRWVGDILDRTDEARRLEQEYLATIESRRPEVGIDGVPTIGLFAGDGYLAIVGNDSSSLDLLGLLGGVDARPETVGGQPADQDSQEISEELLGEALAGADAVVLVTYRGQEDARDTLLANPIFQAVPAVAAGRVAVIDAQESPGNNGLPGVIVTLDRIQADLGR